MLRDLRIRDLGVIEEAAIELADGLNVLTGETGAGKTMVVDAVALLRGERADAGAVRRGRTAASVEARIELDGAGDVRGALAGGGFGDADASEVVAVREVLASGRSRAELQGRMTTVATLAELLGPMIEVHGQHDHQRLLRPDVQRELLDRFAGSEALGLRASFADGLRRLRDVDGTLAELATRARERLHELDLLRHQIAEIEAAAPVVGESTELEAERERLTFAESLLQAAAAARELLAGADLDADGGAVTALAGAARMIAAVAEHDAELAGLAERTQTLGVEAQDLATALRVYGEGAQADPARLEWVGARIAALHELRRKYGDDDEGVLAYARGARGRVDELEHGEERRDALTAEAAELRERLAEQGARLGDLRRQAARRLQAQVRDELAELALEGARLEVRVETGSLDDAGSDGMDRVELFLAASASAPLRPLARAASGGELSRVMLALRVVLAGCDQTPVLVFDEVDAGIGGATAIAVGKRLAALAGGHQVLVVTHLPQIAAFADRHFVVEKGAGRAGGRTVVRAAEGSERIAEVSRMLAGMAESGSARAHAKELLAVAAGSRSQR